jgi:hypothetical protein
VNEPLPPLADLAKQVLRDAQQNAPEPTAAQADRMLGRLKTSVATSAAAGGATAAVAKGAGVMKLAGVALLAGALGLGGGVWLGRTQWAPPPQIIEREKVVEVRVPVPVPAEAPAPPPMPVPAPPQVAPPKSKAAEPKAGVDELLARERELIDTARSALLRSNADGALTALQQHAAQFPAGRLVEERESLWVQVLVARGELDPARARARDFHAKFPRRLLGPTVDAAVAPTP